MASPPPPPPTPLVAASILTSSKRELSSLFHITEKVSSFLDTSVELPLHKACTFGSLKLLNRIWNSTIDLEHEIEPFWSVRSFLRSDKHYQDFQFTVSLVEAVKQRNLEMVQWLFEHFPEWGVGREVVEAAAEVGALSILQFFGQNGRNLNPHDDDEEDEDENNREQRGIDWGYEDATKAAVAGHRDVVMWLYQYAGSYTRDDQKTTLAVIASGDVDLIQWLWERLDMPPGKGMREAAANGHIEMLELLEFQGYGGIDVGQLVKTAEAGQLNAVRWTIRDLDRQDRNYRDWGDCGFALRSDSNRGRVEITRLGWEAGLAIHAAAVNGHLDVAKYLYDRIDIRLDFDDKVQGGRGPNTWMKVLKKLELRSETNLSTVSRDTMVLAAERGFLDVVQWLWAEFGDDPTMNLLSACTNEQSRYHDCALDAAAATGHLAIVQFLHQIGQDPVLEDTRNLKRRRLLKFPELCCHRDPGSSSAQPLGPSPPGTPTCTVAAMDLAAAHGHLDVVRWLHHNRTEGCTTDAMDYAARNGHLNVVQWLHQHRGEGCTPKAMDGAATNGHLDLVKWLHGHRTEGCTAAAMDGAASNGYLDVVLWLHCNKSEGCTTAAMDGAAACGALDVVRWLHHTRSEGCTTAAMDGAAGNGHLRVVRWLYDNRDEWYSVAGMDQALQRSEFECLALLDKIKRGSFTALRGVADSGVRRWLLERYPEYRSWYY